MTSLLRVRTIPKPRLGHRHGWIAASLLCAVVPPSALHAALAAAAGTLFEAAPFVLAARLLPPGRLRALVFLGGCGCRSGPLPGALALPAVALATLTFGWPIALVRTVAALALAARPSLSGFGARRRTAADRTAHDHPSASAAPLDVLAGLVPWAFGAALARETVAPLIAHVAHTAVGAPLLALAGAALGFAMPCATAGIAVAAGLRGTAAPLAFGILATCGMLAATASCVGARAPAVPGATARPAANRAAYALLASLLAAVALRAAPGFVTPRLFPMLGLGALAALACVPRPPLGRRAPGIAPAAMLAALILGSPVPAAVADATALDGAFAGETLDFTGVLQRRGGHAVLERYAIACCRIDARPLAVVLTHDVRLRSGAWARARGQLVREADGRLALEVGAWTPLAAPADPFLYL